MNNEFDDILKEEKIEIDSFWDLIGPDIKEEVKRFVDELTNGEMRRRREVI